MGNMKFRWYEVSPGERKEFKFEDANQGEMAFSFMSDEMWLWKYNQHTKGFVSSRKATRQDLELLKSMQKQTQNFVFDVDLLMNSPRRA